MAKAVNADKPAQAEKPVKAKASKPAKPGVFQRIGQYFKDVRSEMRRVVWPGRLEIRNSTIVVAVTLIVFGGAIATLDFIVVRVLNALSKIGG